jgi:hypothetical protein
MNRLEIIRMAHEAGFMAAGHPMNPWSADTDQIEAFAALVAAHERQACGLIVLDNSDAEGICCTDDVLEAFRQRGEK